MRKQILTLLFIAAFAINCLAQNSSPQDKTFVREVSSTCKMYKDGGCTITTYHALVFKQDSVYVKYYTKSDCDVASRNTRYEKNTREIGAYSYQMHKKRNSDNYIVRINGYEISNLEAFPDKLVEFINDPNYSEVNKIILMLQK